MPKVSVIIPVYNGEPYLRQCLDSVCAQTLEEIEIICVDDGSTDASWQILDEYREKDSRFRLFHQENQHVAVTRNNGLAQAKGKYVIFWDCDDFFEPNALELLYQRAEETGAEICVCSNDLYDQESGKNYPEGFPLNLKRIPREDTFNRFTNPEHILSFTNTAVWNKLFLLSFLTKNDLMFPNFHCGEDYTFTFAALCLASKITTVNEVLIHYRWNNPESLAGKFSYDIQESILSLEFAVDQLIQRDIVPAECLGRRTFQIVRRALCLPRTEEDFLNMLNHLREENGDISVLEKIHIVEREPGYYYGADDDEYVRCLLHDKPGDVLTFFMHDSWRKQRFLATDRRGLKVELKAVKAERKTLKAELKVIKAEQKALKAELKAAKSTLKTTQKTLTALQNSRSYRLGQMLLFIPRKIRDMFRRTV